MSATPDLATAVAEIWQRRRDEVAERVTAIEIAVAALLSGGLAAEERAEALRAAHKLAGSLGTFGMMRGSEAAREIELALAADAPLAFEDAPRLAELATEVRAVVEAGPAVPPPPSPAGAEDPAHDVLLVLAADPRLAAALSGEAHGRGLEIRHAPTPAAARVAAGEVGPAAAIVDLEAPGGDGVLDAIGELAATGTPVLVLCRQAPLADRLAITARGGRGFLLPSHPPAEILDAVTRLAPAPRIERRRVLAVDDDPLVLDALEATLRPHGIDLVKLSHPARFWEAMVKGAPELVLLDVDMPEISGIDLCRVLRADAGVGELPVLFLTAKRDAATIDRLFAAGADDYITKPLVGPELVARIENRLERARLQRELAERDTVTGALQRASAASAAERLLALARRSGASLTVAAVGVDGLRHVNDVAGPAAGDDVLRRLARWLENCLRSHDVVGRWAGDEFILAAHGMDADEAVRRLQEALDTCDLSASGQAVSFTAGVAGYPHDGEDLDGLYRAASGAMARAKRMGGRRVVGSQWHPSASDAPADVVLVEDDAAVAELLVQALETEGRTVRWIADGREAARALARDDGTAPVVLLDVELPGLDGLSVLRLMARHRSLERTRVVMLTARSSEAEVLEALELGAFDHVAKPFSIPILLERVRRALAA